MSQQIDTLQKYFDNCAENAKHSSLSATRQSAEIKNESTFDPALQSIDFKGEAITFKATSEGVLATLQHCVELMGQREDAWRRRLEKENEKKRKMQEIYKALKDQINMHRGDATARPRVLIHGGPDYEVSYYFIFGVKIKKKVKKKMNQLMCCQLFGNFLKTQAFTMRNKFCDAGAIIDIQ